MNTRFLTALLLLSLTQALNTQAQTLNAGEVRYIRTSNWVKMMAQLEYMTPQQKEKMNYMWGNRSEWKTYTVLAFNPEQSLYRDADEAYEDTGYKWRKDPFYVHRHFVEGIMREALTLEGKTYLIEDSLWIPDWRIRNDLKEVAGYLCMNALWQDSVKEQKIVAWFALEIPSSAGPERLGGLPGLILELDINDGALVIAADRITAVEPKPEAFRIPAKIKGRKISRQEYLDRLKKYIQEKKKAEEPYFWGMRY